MTTVDFELPISVNCEDCRTPSLVRACGRIEYDWPKTTTPARGATIPTLNFARLTIDCPKCGVKVQDFSPLSSAEVESRNAVYELGLHGLNQRAVAAARIKRKPK